MFAYPTKPYLLSVPGALGAHVCPGVVALLSRRDVPCVSTPTPAGMRRFSEQFTTLKQLYRNAGLGRPGLARNWAEMFPQPLSRL